MSGFADILARELDTAIGSRAEVALRGMRKNLDRLYRLIAELDWIVQSINENWHPSNSAFSINDLVNDVVSGLQIQHVNRVKLNTEKVPDVFADRVLQGKVFRTLLENALEHSDEVVVVDLKASDDFVSVAVADSGAVMAATDIPSGFAEFVISSPEGRATDTALGLLASKLSIDIQDGKLTAAGDHRGARFEYTIPIAT